MLVIGVAGCADIITAHAIATRLDMGDGAAVAHDEPHRVRVPSRSAR